MFDAVVTFVTKEKGSLGWEGTHTKVFRVEFQSEEMFLVWLESAQRIYGAAAIETLVGMEYEAS